MKAKIMKIEFNSVSSNNVCTCDRCGQHIRNIWTVSFNSGEKINFGIDCFEKVQKSGLTQYGQKEFKKLLKSIRHYTEQNEMWKNISEEEAREKGLLTCSIDANPENEWEDNYWIGHTFEEYKEWILTEWFPERFKENEKKLERFKKIGFEI